MGHPGPTPVHEPWSAAVAAGFARIRAEHGVEEHFDPEVTAEVAGWPPSPPRRDPRSLVDRCDLELRTLDPRGSRDLDQAFLVERRGGGHRVWYAIADPGGWIEPGAAVDRAAWARGVTVYCPDRRVPLHPEVLSEGMASLLPDGADRPSVLWRMDLDGEGELVDVGVERAMVRSRAALAYPEVQRSLEDGTADEGVRLLVEVGRARAEVERARGGVSLSVPAQEVVRDGGRDDLVYDAPAEVEHHNAQLSLLTGMAAATLMLDAGVGLLRTLPPASDEAVVEVRLAARELGVPWHRDQSYGEWLRGLDPHHPTHAAAQLAATRLFRGADYQAFDGTPPSTSEHAAIAAPYAHVTAPLRRLADRFANEVVVAVVAGRRPEDWVIEAMGRVPEVMATASSRAAAVERACIDLIEAVVLSHRVGEVFEATVVARGRDGRSTVQLVDPAVITRAQGLEEVEVGAPVRLRLLSADPPSRTIVFEPAP